MKRKMTLTGMLALLLISANMLAQDTIAGWIFPENSADEFPDVAIPTNVNRFLSCEYGTFGTPSYFELEIDYTANGFDGGTDKCAKTTGWNDGADSIYWMVKFRTPGYKNIKLYSRQKSETGTPGPRDFKIQYKLSGSSPWNELSTVICTDSWENGFVDGISLPAECENLNSNISIRWILASNLDINNNPIQPGGSTLIDNIIITGEAITGIREIEQSYEPVVYPNPAIGTFAIKNLMNTTSIKIYDTRGGLVFEKNINEMKELVIDNYLPGVYFVNCVGKDGHLKSIKTVVR